VSCRVVEVGLGRTDHQGEWVRVLSNNGYGTVEWAGSICLVVSFRNLVRASRYGRVDRQFTAFPPSKTGFFLRGTTSHSSLFVWSFTSFSAALINSGKSLRRRASCRCIVCGSATALKAARRWTPLSRYAIDSCGT
jgi:hypothetical protein